MPGVSPSGKLTHYKKRQKINVKNNTYFGVLKIAKSRFRITGKGQEKCVKN